MISPIDIAAVFGPTLAIVGLWIIICRRRAEDVCTFVVDHPYLLVLGGIVNLLLGLVVIRAHPYWKFDLALLVTVLGWFLSIRGIILLFFSGLFIRFLKKKKRPPLVSGIVAVIWGLLLCWLAWQPFLRFAIVMPYLQEEVKDLPSFRMSILPKK